jgi:hypothetical protein
MPPKISRAHAWPRWHEVMFDCVERGLGTPTALLPGGLQCTPPRTASWRQKLQKLRDAEPL